MKPGSFEPGFFVSTLFVLALNWFSDAEEHKRNERLANELAKELANELAKEFLASPGFCPWKIEISNAPCSPPPSSEPYDQYPLFV